MKKIISILLVITLVVAFSACGKKEVGSETQKKPGISGEVVNDNSAAIKDWLNSDKEENNEQETEPSTNEEKPSIAEWQQKYETTLQKCINEGVLFGAIYIADTNNDGIPTVALATNPYWFKIPDMIINYVNGNVVIQGQIEEVVSGYAITKEVYFVKGVNDFVFRSVGNYLSTFGISEYQRIYTLSSYGVYETSEKSFSLPDDLQKEYTEALENNNYDNSKYVNYIVDEMNRDLVDVYGKQLTLIKFNDVAETFLIESEDEISLNQRKAVEYLNKKLGINLVYKS